MRNCVITLILQTWQYLPNCDQYILLILAIIIKAKNNLTIKYAKIFSIWEET